MERLYRVQQDGQTFAASERDGELRRVWGRRHSDDQGGRGGRVAERGRGRM